MSLCHCHSTVATPCTHYLGPRIIHDTHEAITVNSPSSTTILSTIASLVSSNLACPNGPHGAAIDQSLAEGPLSKFSGCSINAAAREYALGLSREVVPAILPEIETILLRNQDSQAKERERAENSSMEHARLLAEKVAEDAATRAASRIHEMLASSIEFLTCQAAAMASAESDEKVSPSMEASLPADSQTGNIPAPPDVVQPANSLTDDISAPVVKPVDPPADNISAPPESVIQPAEAKAALDNFVNTNMPWLRDDNGVVTQRIAKAAKNVPAVTTKFQVPAAQAAQMAGLALYEFIVLCDDTGSMRSEKQRRPTQEATVRGLFSFLKDLGSTQPFLLIPFDGMAHGQFSSLAEVNRVLGDMSYRGGSSALKPLQARILEPLKERARRGDLKPTVVVVITDGNTGDVTYFRKALAEFKTAVQRRYPGPTVLFLVCRVGSDEAAARSLKALNSDPDIRDMVMYSENQLDSKLADMNNDVDHYTGWVVGELLKAMELQLVQGH